MSGCFIRDSCFTAVKQYKTAAAAAAAGLIRQQRGEMVPLVQSLRSLSADNIT